MAKFYSLRRKAHRLDGFNPGAPPAPRSSATRYPLLIDGRLQQHPPFHGSVPATGIRAQSDKAPHATGSLEISVADLNEFFDGPGPGAGRQLER